MAEILIRAKSHWMDDFSQAQIDAMSVEERQARDSRIQIGDIVVVRPNGWTWGKEECLPTFIVVKLPDVTVEAVKAWEEALMDNTDPEHPVLLKRRKHRVPTNYMNTAIANGKSVITIDLPAGKTAFINNIVTKTE